MNKILTLLTLCFSLSAFAQNDSVTLGAGATDMVFYNIGTGTKTTASNNDWHIAFTVRPALFPYNTNQAAALRINEANGLKLYRSPNQTLTTWSTFDTAGYTGWQQLHNPDTTWTIGAFNVNKDFNNLYNYGWGNYVFAEHSVVSDSSIYLLQLPDGSFRKFAMLALVYDTAFEVQFDKLDNSDFTTQEVRKIPYRTKSFVYYNLETKTILDKEPALTDWDMVFLRYTNSYDSTNITKDMGILTNDAKSVYAASGSTAQQACYSGTYSNYINVIGKSWMDQNDSIIPGLAYFISGGTRFAMAEFGGSATGLMGFDISLCSTAGIADVNSNTSAISAYPVPASDILNVKLSSDNQTDASIQLLDMSGRMIQSQSAIIRSGENNFSLNISALQSGNYILSVSSAGGKMNRMVSVVR
jgi:hypothetical protein